ncbi:MAG: caspase family protein [Marinilabiliales bacterium]|nr:caspase family protein [Marinilabiliales bacterium]
MARGLSLHIGLNQVDGSQYQNRFPVLRHAENDTNYYFGLAMGRHFEAMRLIGKEATSDRLVDCLTHYAKQMQAGDLCFITYSGHGTKVRDLNGEEEDGYDEVMVLYDRLFIDDEFTPLWAQFAKGVRIFLLNDSCYNGTVSRFVAGDDTNFPKASEDHLVRGIDSSLVRSDFERHLDYFCRIKADMVTGPADCSILHISACRDDQEADDGSVTETNGKFTATVRKMLETENFEGSYRDFFESVRQRMPPWQTPGMDTKAGTEDAAFELAPFLRI